MWLGKALVKKGTREGGERGQRRRERNGKGLMRKIGPIWFFTARLPVLLIPGYAVE